MNRAPFLVALVLVAALAGSTGGALAATGDDAPSAIDIPTAATNNTTDTNTTDTNTTDTNTTDTNTTDANTTDTNASATNTTDTNTTDANTTDTNTTDANTTDANTTDTNTTNANTTDTNASATNTTDANTSNVNTTYSTVPSTCTYPFTSTDATGASVTVEGAPERIVAIGPSATQTLWEIGAQDRVVGIQHSSYVAYLDNASAKPDIPGDFAEADVESIVAQSPDMVLLANIESNTTAQRLRQAGITVYKFEAAGSIDDIYAKTRLIGHLAGNCDGAEDTVDWMQDRLDTVEQVRERADSTPTMFYPMSGSYTAGSGTFITDVMRLGGTRNVALDAGVTGYADVTEEFVLKYQPKWLLATYALPSHGGPESLLPQTQAINQSEAYQEGRVVAVNSNYLSQPAPRVVYAIENITEAVHPDAWAAVHDTGSAHDDDDHDIDWEDLSASGSSGSTTTASEAAETANATAENETANASAGPTVTLVRENGSVAATVHNATGTVSIDLANVTAANASVNTTAANTSANATANMSANATALTGANVSLRANVNATELTFTASEPTTAVPAETVALDEATPVRYFTANVSGVDAEDIATATLRFSVTPADLPNGTEPTNVTLYRYHNASWGALPTEHLNGSAYAATTPGFSAFAISTSNETAAQNATGENTTTTTSTVSPTATSTTNATTTSGTLATSTSSGSSPGFGPAIAALALALVACLLRRR